MEKINADIIKENIQGCIKHERYAIPFIQKVIREFDPKMFIEIGTKYGGFTYIVYKTCPNIEIYTYDIKNEINDWDNKKSFNNEKFHFYNIDTFDVQSIVDITKLCQDSRRKFLYCDGGSKIKEMLIFGPYLNKGDLLGCHDWPTEINYDSVGHYVKGLIPLEDNRIFELNNWGSRFYQIP